MTTSYPFEGSFPNDKSGEEKLPKPKQENLQTPASENPQSISEPSFDPQKLLEYKTRTISKIQSKSQSNIKWVELLKWLIGAVIVSNIPLVLQVHADYNQDVQSQQTAVKSYIETIRVLLLDDYPAVGKKPDIDYNDIQLFIRSQAGSTLKQLSNSQQKDILIRFLREAKIGFNPRNPSERLQLTRKDEIHLDLLRGIDLNSAPLDDADLALAIFQDADLNNAQLKRASLADANLRKALLREAKLNGAILINADLRGAQLRKADFSKSLSHFKRENFWPSYKYGEQKTTLKGINLRGADLQGVILEEADLTGANLISANLNDATDKGEPEQKTIHEKAIFTYTLYSEKTVFPNSFKLKEKSQKYCMILVKPALDIEKVLEECNKQGVELKSFRNTDLSNLDLSKKANLKEVEFRFSDLHNTNLQEANLQKSDFQGANLQGANLQGANLQGANLQGAILDYTYLKDVKFDKKTKVDDKWKLVADIVNNPLKNKNLGGKDLSKANLQGANLQGVILTKADLTDANLKGANIKDTNLQQATLCRTILPNGTTSKRDC